jgi:hypothetical protein
VASTKVVTLVTGDRVVLSTTPGGQQTAALEPRSARRDSFVTRRIGGDLYVLPAGAVPYLGRSLDMALFDVSALVRDNPDGRVPVRVSYAAGAAQNAPPGVTLTGTGTASARDGYVSTGSAAQFGAALDTQRAADAAAHWAGDRRLYGAVTSIRYAGRGPAAVIRPRFAMFTVKLPVLGVQGEPAPFGAMEVINVDDSLKFDAFPAVVDGDVRLSMPAGHYSADLYYPVFDEAGNYVESRFAVTDFEVTGPTTHPVDVRTATSQISFRTPRAADLRNAKLGWARGSGDGGFSNVTLVDGGAAPLFVSPAPAAAVGVQHYFARAQLTSPAGTAAPYSYELNYPSDTGIQADQRYVVTADSLATVRHTFYSEHQQTGLMFTFATLPWSFDLPQPLLLDLPQHHTEYVSANPQLTYNRWGIVSRDNFGGVFFSGLRSYRPRTEVAEEWFRQPLTPGFLADTGVGAFVCTACRNGDLLSVFVAPVIDSTPDHFANLDSPGAPGVVSTNRFQLLSGSTVLDDENDVTGGAFSVPAGSAPYRLIYDETRQAPWFGLSPVSHTEWTFTSGHSGRNTVPDRVICLGEDVTCSAVPLLTLNYRLGTNLSGAMRPGPASLRLSVGHTAFGPAAPVSSAKVSVSFDGGRRWTPVRTRRLGAGAYQATWTNPASTAGPLVLRVEAADAAGSTISQTVQQPFTIAAGGSGA